MYDMSFSKPIAAVAALTQQANFDIARLFRYLVAGVTGTATNILILYFLTAFAHVWYLTSGIVSFSVSVVVSFILQKYWTFQHDTHEGVHHQAAYYLLVALINLGINTLILYGLVDYAHIQYLVGQVIASGIIACESYVIYHYIFERRSGILSA